LCQEGEQEPTWPSSGATNTVAWLVGRPIANQGTVFYDADGNGTNESSALTDDPGQPGAQDPTAFVVAAPIPALSTVGFIVLTVVLAALGMALTRRFAA
jgi:hypothetical protein